MTPRPTPRPTLTPNWVRLALLAIAVGLGVEMLIGAARLGTIGLSVVLQLLVGSSFVACGLYLWARRPANRLGPLMTGVGLVWLLGRTMQVVPDALVYPLGLWLTDLWTVGFAWFLLAFPTGRLRGRADLAVIGIFLVVSVPLELLWLMFLEPPNGLNVFAVAADPVAADVVDRVQRFTLAAGAVLLIAVFARRWVSASSPARRQMWPALVGAGTLVAQSTSWMFFTFGNVPDWLNIVIRLAYIAIPVAVLGAILRARLARAAVADLVVELGTTPTPARLRDALASALGDPGLQVAWWAPGEQRFVDAAGAPVELPAPGTGQAVTMLERDGVGEAAILHDPSLLEDPGLIASVAGALRLAVANDRLTTEVETQLAEVRASRARIVEAGDTERKRVERDLHDGAQQRLVALSLELRVAQNALPEQAEPALRQSLSRAADEARAALAELRDLALGIHPLILTESGLGQAVESLADRTAIDVSVDVGDERYSPAIEGAAYFVISEALANVTKYARATKASVRIRRLDDDLTLEVVDDGAGGADPRGGSGLRGLADRLAALDGTMTVDSPVGGGTRLAARIPIVRPATAPVPTL